MLLELCIFDDIAVLGQLCLNLYKKKNTLTACMLIRGAQKTKALLEMLTGTKMLLEETKLVSGFLTVLVYCVI